jgi:predicted nucleotidyltransferase
MGMHDPDELGKDKRAAILAIAAKHGAQRVRVFGSFARGDARVDSDIQDAVLRNLQTPAESTQRISDGLRPVIPR